RVHEPDRGRHRARRQQRAERRQKARREQRAASGLRRARGERLLLARREAELLLEEAARALRTVAAEPAEQLLRAVADEQTADRHAQDRHSKAHWVPASVGCICAPSGALSTPRFAATGAGKRVVSACCPSSTSSRT